MTPDQRWGALVACIRWCKPGGSLLIIEDGAFSAVKNRAALLYELLLGCADVLVNSVLYPGWLGAGDYPGEHFYLRHLTLADITMLESVFPTHTKRDAEWVHAGFFPQILIRYTFGIPVSTAV